MLDYYDYSPVLGRDAPYTFICGARGLGKTYGAKMIAIRKFVKKGRRFIYLRRFKNELKGQQGFFSDIAHEFPEWEFRVNGNKFQCRRVEDVEAEENFPWSDMGVMLALSQSSYVKSVSYAEYDTIIFDEFIIEKGSVHYLPQEAKRFNDFYSTVDRYNDRVRVYFLANAVSITNPYFIEYGVRLREGQEWYRYHDGFVCVHVPSSELFASQVTKTRFGKFLRDSDPAYAEYAINNKFKDQTATLIAKKPSDAKPMWTLYTPIGIMGLWHKSPYTYVTEKTAGDVRGITTSPGMVSEEITYCPYGSTEMKVLRASFETGRCFFQTPSLREKFLEVYRR